MLKKKLHESTIHLQSELKGLNVSQEKMDINLQFYIFLKIIVKVKISEFEINSILENYYLFKHNSDLLMERVVCILGKKLDKDPYLLEVLQSIDSELKVEIFLFSLKLCQIKDLLLGEARVYQIKEIEKLYEKDPLSLEYDNISLIKPYSSRVRGVLLSLLFFKRIEQDTEIDATSDSADFIKNLSYTASKLRSEGLEPNQIFTLIFSDSVSQSIKSTSGSDYENRVLSVLLKNGIDKDKIKKMHDIEDSSTEYDFIFQIEDKKYGISAKRTLRERFKQSIKTNLANKDIIRVEMTLGMDLTEEKAKSILKHGSYIFVSDEVYQRSKFLKDLEGVYSAKDFNCKTLKNLSGVV